MSNRNLTHQTNAVDGMPQQPNEAVPDAQTASDAALDRGEGLDSQFNKVCVGVLYLKHEYDAAVRFKTEVEKHHRVQAKLFHHEYTPPASDPKVDEIADFSRHCHAFIWLATPSSVEDGDMKHHRSFCHHKSIKNRDKIFVAGIPEECPNVELPETLQSYTPLSEDNLFQGRMEAFIKHILKRLSNQNINLGQTTQAENRRPETAGPTYEQQTQTAPTDAQPGALPGENIQPETPHASNQQPAPVFNVIINNASIDFLQVGGESKNTQNEEKDTEQDGSKLHVGQKDLIQFDEPNAANSNETHKDNPDQSIDKKVMIKFAKLPDLVGNRPESAEATENNEGLKLEDKEEKPE